METVYHPNPVGLDGFEFIEFSAPDPQMLAENFRKLGFTPFARHRSKEITLFRQGHINFLLNAEPNSQAAEHAKIHGPGACSIGFKVKDAKAAYQYVLSAGARFAKGGINEENPGIEAIGGSLIYLIDHKKNSFYEMDFIPLSVPVTDIPDCGLQYIDHLTNNVNRGDIEKWSDYYMRLFGFLKNRYFDIQGEQTGFVSFVLASPCGKIKIPLNESSDDKSQIAEFLKEYHGEGIQHIALNTKDIYETVEKLREREVNFLDTPDTYYEKLQERLDWHEEDVARMRRNKILLDGGATAEEGLLLQIFTKNIFGPEFFEIIQRKNNEGFGEGNFQALFEAIERDQKERGTL